MPDWSGQIPIPSGSILDGYLNLQEKQRRDRSENRFLSDQQNAVGVLQQALGGRFPAIMGANNLTSTGQLMQGEQQAGNIAHIGAETQGLNIGNDYNQAAAPLRLQGLNIQNYTGQAQGDQARAGADVAWQTIPDQVVAAMLRNQQGAADVGRTNASTAYTQAGTQGELSSNDLARQLMPEQVNLERLKSQGLGFENMGRLQDVMGTNPQFQAGQSQQMHAQRAQQEHTNLSALQAYQLVNPESISSDVYAHLADPNFAEKYLGPAAAQRANDPVRLATEKAKVEAAKKKIQGSK